MTATPSPIRYSACIEGDFVVFLIGLRINAFHRPDKWWPAVAAMPQMLTELFRQPDRGLLGARTRWAGRHVEVIQYWRSFEHLRAYARDRESAHLPAWRAFNQAARGNGSVGIWHETFLVPDGAYESVYVAMPPHGLAAAAATENVDGEKASASGRLGRGAEAAPAGV